MWTSLHERYNNTCQDIWTVTEGHIQRRTNSELNWQSTVRKFRSADESKWSKVNTRWVTSWDTTVYCIKLQKKTWWLNPQEEMTLDATQFSKMW